MEDENPKETNKSASDLIQRIKIGALDPHILNKEQRQLCVEALYFDSVSPSGIAQFLKVSDRTLRRDMADIRARNALTPNPDLAREIIGEFVLFAKIHRGNLMKLSRNTSASTAERGQAEYYAYMVGADMVVKLQSLGYLPKSADALLVMQRTEDRVSNERISAVCAELDDMARLADNPEQAKKLIEIKDTLPKENDNDLNKQ